MKARLLGLVYLFFVCSNAARADAPTSRDFEPDPRAVQRYGPAYRFPQAGWIVLHIEGEPYERGYQHGRLLAPEIAGYLRCFAAVLSPKAPAEGWQHIRKLTNALFLRRFEKEYLEEMKGIADGATAAGARFDKRPIDLVDVVALNCWPEIETLESALEATPTGLEGIRFPHQQPRAKPAPRPDHCSAFAATGPATADGKIVFGHITMFGLYPANFYNVWIDIKPAKGHRVLMCAYPGAMQSGMDYYMNDAGLLIAETTISQTRFDIKGKTEASRIRQAIQYAKTIDEAVDILRTDNNGLYTNEWLLGDINTNEIALFELGTHKSKLHRSSKKEWLGGTEGFYWGCNNTKDLELRLEAVPSVHGRPHNVVFRPSERDIAWQRLYREHKGKIDVSFGKLAFTTPPIAAYPSLDAKFTTTDLARQLKSWALFGPPLGRTWEPTAEELQRYPEIKPLFSHPWTLLHGKAPDKQAKTVVAVDLPHVKSDKEAAPKEKIPLLDVPAWHGTLLPQSDGDIWLATAFAEYERYVAKEKAFKAAHADGKLTQEERDELAVDLFGHHVAYQSATRKVGATPLTAIKADWTNDDGYRIASGRGVLTMHEIRRSLGDAAFVKAMDSFGREHAGKKVHTQQFREHAEKSSGKNLFRSLEALFDALNDESVPEVRLRKVRIERQLDPSPPRGATELSRVPFKSGSSNSIVSSGRVLKGEIVIKAEHESLTTLDVTLETSAGETTHSVPVSVGWPKTFGIEVGEDRIRRVVLEKYSPTARADGAFSIVSFHREQEQTLIVYGTSAEALTNREAAEVLQRTLRSKWQNHTVPIKADKDVTNAELKSHHVLLIGRPDSNVLIERFRENLPITFGPQSFVVRGKTYAHPGSAVLAAADNPLDGRYSIVVVAGLSPASIRHAATTLVQRRQRPAEVLVLPHEGAAQALVIPGRQAVVDLHGE